MPLEHISKVHILLIRQILESVNIALVIRLAHARGGSGVALLVQADEVEAQEDDDQQQQDVAAHVRAEGDEVAGLVGVAEDLWAWYSISLGVRFGDLI